MTGAEALFEEAVAWLRSNYWNTTFFVERDIVWTLQRKLGELVAKEDVRLAVFNDYPVLPGKRRGLSADIAIVGDGGRIELVAEFKYEPSHYRDDIPREKFPVVSWDKEGVAEDLSRIQRFVSEGGVAIGHFLFIDEGGAFHHREPHPNSVWESWGGNLWVLRSRVCRKDTHAST